MKTTTQQQAQQATATQATATTTQATATTDDYVFNYYEGASATLTMSVEAFVELTGVEVIGYEG